MCLSMKIKKAETSLTSAAEAGLAEGEAAMERVLHGRTAQLWALMHQSDRFRVLKSELVAHEIRNGFSTDLWREWAKVPEPRLMHTHELRSPPRVAATHRDLIRASPDPGDVLRVLITSRHMLASSMNENKDLRVLRATGRNFVQQKGPPPARSLKPTRAPSTPVCADYLPRFGLGGYRSYGLQSYYVRNPEPDVGPRAQLLGTTVWHVKDYVKDTFKGGGAASARQ